MTDTDTSDIVATAQQILDLAQAGSEVVRITVDRPEAAKAVPKIVEKVRQQSMVPIVGDFHFSGHRLLREYPEMTALLDKYRINPGNLGSGSTRDKNFEQILEIAAKNQKPIRIGVNGGSLDRQLLTRLMDRNSSSAHPKSANEVFAEAMVQSALVSSRFAISASPKTRSFFLQSFLTYIK